MHITKDCYSAINKNGIIQSAGKLIELKKIYITQSEVTQAEKDKLHVFSPMQILALNLLFCILPRAHSGSQEARKGSLRGRH